MDKKIMTFEVDKSKKEILKKVKEFQDDSVRYRMDFETSEMEELLKLLQHIDATSEDDKELVIGSDITIYEKIKKKILNPKKIKKSIKKTVAAEDATLARTKKAKEKIQNAINYLKMMDKNITAYSISKESGVSYNTVRKYIKDIKL